MTVAQQAYLSTGATLPAGFTTDAVLPSAPPTVPGSSVAPAGPGDLALHRPVTVSRADDAPASAQFAVDLQASCEIEAVTLVFDDDILSGAATSFTLDVSDDGKTWRNVHQTTSGPGPSGEVGIPLPKPVTAQYVRMTSTARSHTYPFALNGFRVYGTVLLDSDWNVTPDDFAPGGLDNPNAPEAPSRHGWCYRRPFTVPRGFDTAAGRHVWLEFDGVDHEAVAWVDGQNVGALAHPFSRAAFDITSALAGGASAEHDLEVQASGRDWMPAVDDRATGIWDHVRLRSTGDAVLGDPRVTTTLPKLPDTSVAEVTIAIPVSNAGAVTRTIQVTASFDDVTVSGSVSVAAGQSATITFAPADYPQLTVHRPRLWWPNGYGEPALHDLGVTASTGGATSDRRSHRFGIREFGYSSEDDQWIQVASDGFTWTDVLDVDDMTTRPTISCNGVEIFCRGGNWGWDEPLRRVLPERMRQIVAMHRGMNFTMIRNWIGSGNREELYAACDENGIMVWNDFWDDGWNAGLANAVAAEDPEVYCQDESADASTLAGFCARAQFANYESVRAIFEAWTANPWRNTSAVLPRMSRPAWHSTAWQQTYDHHHHDLDVDGAYYGARKGCEPLHIQADPTTWQTLAANHTPRPVTGATITASVYGLDGTLLSRAEQRGLNIAPAGTAPGLTVAWDSYLPDLHLVRLQLTDKHGSLLSQNTYWRSADATDATNMTALDNLSLTRLAVRLSGSGDTDLTATITNKGSVVAAMVRLSLQDQDGARILPTQYGDNYLWLLPGESREVAISRPDGSSLGRDPHLVAQAYNSAAVTASRSDSASASRLRAGS